MKIDSDQFRKAALVAGLAAGLAAFGCGGSQESEQAAAPEPAPAPKVEQPKPQPPPPPAEPTPPPKPEQQTAEASYMQDTHWAPNAEGKLIQGLNGGQYSPYAASLVRDVQEFLFNQDIYEGPVTGVLDEQTMQAIAKFQGEHGIMKSGVPSPETRQAMQAVQAQNAGAT